MKEEKHLSRVNEQKIVYVTSIHVTTCGSQSFNLQINITKVLLHRHHHCCIHQGTTNFTFLRKGAKYSSLIVVYWNERSVLQR